MTPFSARPSKSVPSRTTDHAHERSASFIALAAVAFCILSVSWVEGATIRVPTDQPTIQAGIDAAVPGDSVLVAPGSYSGPGNREIDFGGKDLVLLSEGGATIEGPGIYPLDEYVGFTFHSGETEEAVVEGFTIRNFFAFEQVTASAMSISPGSSPTVRGCVFLDNGVVDLSGGAVRASGGVFEDCFFLSNVSEGWNGAGRGGALSISNTTLRRCVVRGNQARESQFGVGVGGGILAGPGVVLEDCIIVDNEADFAGGIYVELGGTSDSEVMISGSTVADNQAGLGGSQISFQTYAPSGIHRLSISTSIIWSSGACGPNDIDTGEEFEGTSRVTFTCSINDRSAVSGGIETLYGPHSSEDDPLFCDPFDCGGAGGGDYSLLPESPCLPGNSSCGALIGAVEEVCGTSAVTEAAASIGFELGPVHPNPAENRIRFALRLAGSERVRAEVFGPGGRRIAQIVEGVFAAGEHELLWNLRDATGRRVSAGLYVLRVATDEGTRTARVTVLD